MLDAALEQYRQRHEDENTDPDEMILSAGDYLLRVLEPVQQQHNMRRYMLMGAAGVGSLLAAGLLLRRVWASSSSSSSSESRSGSSSGGSGAGALAAAGSSMVWHREAAPLVSVSPGLQR